MLVLRGKVWYREGWGVECFINVVREGFTEKVVIAQRSEGDEGVNTVDMTLEKSIPGRKKR